jgi:murein DD-endopeptidase MepM/ murein hydrolase activator NlpD
MSTFPLGRPPSVTWHQNSTNTYFGAPRGGGFPIHGACDLIAPAGTKVLAVQDGRIVRFYPFVTYCKGSADQTTTWAMDVAHEHYMIRYGEISSTLPEGVHAGGTITEGQVIAFVGAQCGGTMLHFEMFDDPARPDLLTDRYNKKYLYVPDADYERRNDLLDPTGHLDRWYSDMPATWFIADGN